MALYMKKPKGLWQKVLFRFKSAEVIEAVLWDGSCRWSDYPLTHQATAAWFEDNYQLISASHHIITTPIDADFLNRRITEMLNDDLLMNILSKRYKYTLGAVVKFLESKKDNE